MPGRTRRAWRVVGALAVAAGFAACASQPVHDMSARPAASAHDLAVLDRLSWGTSTASADIVAGQGLARYIEAQLAPSADDGLPPEVADEIRSASAQLAQGEETAQTLQRERQDIKQAQGPDEKIAAVRAYQQTLQSAREAAATRALLRDLYSRNQLLEQMTWFWMNHFNVFANKADVGAWIGDYEERAIRPHALGHFCDLLAATVHHPAMLIYLDNAQNARSHLNENYARELMELHTLGVNGGYTQEDVEELARILTGLGVNETGITPPIPAVLAGQYVRDGLFEFDPRRHDYGAKMFLGHRIDGAGLAEVDAALDLLCRNPATAHFISRKIALFFVSDDPPERLVARMAARFRATDGDIAAVLRTMIASPEFAASLGRKFKDPMHFVVSAVRAATGDDIVRNTDPLQGWLNLLGERLYGCDTPNGYALAAAPWSGSGDMLVRFKIARVIAGGAAKLFGAADSPQAPPHAAPQIRDTPWYRARAPSLGASTKSALAQAQSPASFDMLFLSSPEFMNR